MLPIPYGQIVPYLIKSGLVVPRELKPVILPTQQSLTSMPDVTFMQVHQGSQLKIIKLSNTWYKSYKFKSRPIHAQLSIC